jgi:hypothetical protein
LKNGQRKRKQKTVAAAARNRKQAEKRPVKKIEPAPAVLIPGASLAAGKLGHR